MKNRRFLIVSLSILVIAGMVVGLYWKRWGEPWYQGKSLRTWLQEGVTKWMEGGDDASKESREAVQKMGTNAIPALLRMLRATDSRLTKMRVTLHNRYEFFPMPDTALDEHLLAAWGFSWLGANATNAIPQLNEVFRDNIQQSSGMAYEILLNIVSPDEKAVLLKEGQTNRSDAVRGAALWELTPTNTPGKSVPILIKALNDPSPGNQIAAASKLRRFGTNALPAVPSLVPLAAMGTTNIHYNAARQTLIVLDPVTAAKVLTNGTWTYQDYTNRLEWSKRSQGVRPEFIDAARRGTNQ